MNKETYEALKRIIYGKKGSQKKRLAYFNDNVEDFLQVEVWIEETAKEHD